MLVLTRKRQEQIRIGDQITITIVRIKGNCVQVGIEAPGDVRVVRGELPPRASDPAPTEPAAACPPMEPMDTPALFPCSGSPCSV